VTAHSVTLSVTLAIKECKGFTLIDVSSNATRN